MKAVVTDEPEIAYKADDIVDEEKAFWVEEKPLPLPLVNYDGLTSEEAADRCQRVGFNRIPHRKQLSTWVVFLHRLTILPTAFLLWIAIILEAYIHKSWAVFAILTFMQFINAWVPLVTGKPNKGDPLTVLKRNMANQQNVAVKRDGQWTTIDSKLLVPGDVVKLSISSSSSTSSSSSSWVPADCRLLSGELVVNQVHITGEAQPLTLYKNDSCIMGSIVIRGEVEVVVENTGVNTMLGKIDAQCMQSEIHTSQYFREIGGSIYLYLYGISYLLCLAHFTYLYVVTRDVQEAVSLTLVLLVASIPLTLEIIVQSIVSLGVMHIESGPIHLKNNRTIERLACVSVLCIDMPRYVTAHEILQELNPVYIQGETESRVLMYAALAAERWDDDSCSMDFEILQRVDESLLETFVVLEKHSWNPSLQYSECVAKDTSNEITWHIRKGDPRVLLQLVSGPHDNIDDDIMRLEEEGCYVVAIAVAHTQSDSFEWNIAGLLSFHNDPNISMVESIQKARDLGLDLKIMTKDSPLVAKYVVDALGFGKYSIDAKNAFCPSNTNPNISVESDMHDITKADSFSHISAELKSSVVMSLVKHGQCVGVTGSTMYDVSSFNQANLSITAPEAVEALTKMADVLLQEHDISYLIDSITIARKVFARVKMFAAFRFSVTCHLFAFLFISTFAFKPSTYTQPNYYELNGAVWPQFYQMPILLILIIYLLNDCILAVPIGYVHVQLLARPCAWKYEEVVKDFMFGFIHLGSTLLLLQILLNSWSPDSFWMKLRLNGVQYGEIISAIYLKLSLSQIVCLLLTHTGHDWFMRIRSLPMVVSAICVMIISSILALCFPNVVSEEIEVMGLRNHLSVFGFVWVYSLFTLFVHVIVIVTLDYFLRKNLYSSTVHDTGVSPAILQVKPVIEVQVSSAGNVDEEIEVQANFQAKVDGEIIPNRGFGIFNHTDGNVLVRQLNMRLQVDLLRKQHYRHPNIVSIVDFSMDPSDDDKTYIIYDCNSTKSVYDILLNAESHQVLGPTRRIEIMYDISMALTYLHQADRGFHGDVKSDGIVLASDGRAMLLSCPLSDFYFDPKSFSKSGPFLGTPGYTCPWYSQGGKRFRSDCDIFSFGVVMIELITGHDHPDVDRYTMSTNGMNVLISDAERVGWENVVVDLCSLAVRCIDPSPIRRPTAEMIQDSLASIIGKMDS